MDQIAAPVVIDPVQAAPEAPQRAQGAAAATPAAAAPPPSPDPSPAAPPIQAAAEPAPLVPARIAAPASRVAFTLIDLAWRAL